MNYLPGQEIGSVFNKTKENNKQREGILRMYNLLRSYSQMQINIEPVPGMDRGTVYMKVIRAKSAGFYSRAAIQIAREEAQGRRLHIDGPLIQQAMMDALSKEDVQEVGLSKQPGSQSSGIFQQGIGGGASPEYHPSDHFKSLDLLRDGTCPDVGIIAGKQPCRARI